MTAWRLPPQDPRPFVATFEEVAGLAQGALDLVDSAVDALRSTLRGIDNDVLASAVLSLSSPPEVVLAQSAAYYVVRAVGGVGHQSADTEVPGYSPADPRMAD